MTRMNLSISASKRQAIYKASCRHYDIDSSCHSITRDKPESMGVSSDEELTNDDQDISRPTMHQAVYHSNQSDD